MDREAAERKAVTDIDEKLPWQTPRREIILEKLDQLADALLEGDRKEDSLLPLGEIEAATAAQEVTIGEMTLRFEERLRGRIPVPE
jgi:hypothetical protein